MPLADLSKEFPALISRLKRVRRENLTAHAYLFTGSNKETLQKLAMAWMQACACPTPQNDDACGQCPICRALAAETYTGLQIIRPRSRLRQITIEVMRELEKNLQLKSNDPLRIGWITEAECMNENAQNAFLKTLEEPNPNTLLLLLSTRPARLLPTIRSRCQVIALQDNQVRYQFEGFEELCQALGSLRRGRGALVATKAANKILDILERLKNTAEAQSLEKMQTRLAAFTEPDKVLKKKLEDEQKADSASAYLDGRQQLLSAIETWFNQEYIRAGGIKRQYLPNPEFYQYMREEPPPFTPTPGEAQKNITQVEELMQQLAFNVSEPLTIQDFCQQVCAKGG